MPSSALMEYFKKKMISFSELREYLRQIPSQISM